MTLTKKDLNKFIQKQNGYTVYQSTEMVDTVIQQKKSCLENGEDLMLEARKVVTFKFSAVLRDKVNGEE